jgi:hypothetical protein
VKVENLAKNGQMVQNCYPLSPSGRTLIAQEFFYAFSEFQHN